MAYPLELDAMLKRLACEIEYVDALLAQLTPEDAEAAPSEKAEVRRMKDEPAAAPL